MPELSLPTVRVRLSFLAAMAEFESEGRGGAYDDTMIGGEIRGYGPGWATREGFEEYVRWPANSAWYARYRVICHDRARSGSDASAGSGTDIQVQPVTGPSSAPGPGAPGSMNSARSTPRPIRFRTKRSPAKLPSISPRSAEACPASTASYASALQRTSVASTMVMHHTASPMSANACGRSPAFTLASRSVVWRIPMTDHWSALTLTAGSSPCSRFHATVQPPEQNRACSRRGVNAVPHCSQFRVSVTQPDYASTRVRRRTKRRGHWRAVRDLVAALPDLDPTDAKRPRPAPPCAPLTRGTSAAWLRLGERRPVATQRARRGPVHRRRGRPDPAHGMDRRGQEWAERIR
jgi:hypothetical protein